MIASDVLSSIILSLPLPIEQSHQKRDLLFVCVSVRFFSRILNNYDELEVPISKY